MTTHDTEGKKVRIKKPANFQPEKFFPEDHASWPGKRRCKAWTPNEGRQCLRPAMRGKDVCPTHGGRTPSGIASPNYVHGRYSKYLPGELLERYQDAIGDPEILALTGEIALARARTTELLDQLKSEDGEGAWKEARRAYDAMRRSMASQNKDGLAKAIEDLDRALRHGEKTTLIWDQVFEVSDLTRRLVESERKRLTEMEQMLSIDRVLSMMRALSMSVQENVRDPKALAKIQQDFLRYSA